MAKKKQIKKTKKNVELEKKVDSLVDEIERTNNFKLEELTNDDSYIKNEAKKNKNSKENIENDNFKEYKEKETDFLDNEKELENTEKSEEEKDTNVDSNDINEDFLDNEKESEDIEKSEEEKDTNVDSSDIDEDFLDNEKESEDIEKSEEEKDINVDSNDINEDFLDNEKESEDIEKSEEEKDIDFDSSDTDEDFLDNEKELEDIDKSVEEKDVNVDLNDADKDLSSNNVFKDELEDTSKEKSKLDKIDEELEESGFLDDNKDIFSDLEDSNNTDDFVDIFANSKPIGLDDTEDEKVQKELSDKYKISTQRNIEYKEKYSDLNKTNSYDFSFDDDRLDELESLDTSFLEGRINFSEKKKIKKNSRSKIKEARKLITTMRRKRILIFLIVICTFTFVVGIASIIQVNNIKLEKAKEELEKQEKEKEQIENELNQVIDENYLFVGDNLTEDFMVDDYFDNQPVVNSSKDEYTTKDLYDNLYDMVFRYNPSKIFIQIGTYDYTLDDGNNSIEENIPKIIKSIKENRPYAKIYIESLYPINDNDDEEKIDLDMVDERNNEDIEKINDVIEEICKKNKVNYIDLYSKLYNEDDNGLDLDFTTNGFHISDKGYEVIKEEIEKYL